jgi:hypothetical protein
LYNSRIGFGWWAKNWFIIGKVCHADLVINEKFKDKNYGMACEKSNCKRQI